MPRRKLLYEETHETLKRQGRWETAEGNHRFLLAVLADVLMERLGRDEALSVLRDAGWPTVTPESLATTLEAFELEQLAATMPPEAEVPVSWVATRCADGLDRVERGTTARDVRSLTLALAWLCDLVPDHPLLARARSLGVPFDDA